MQLRFGLHLAGIILLSVLAISCNRGTRYQVLRVFFDGIPSSDSLAARKSNHSADPARQASNAAPDSLRSAQPAWHYHPTQETNECQTCHDIGQSFRLYAETSELCARCHTFLDNPIVHEPLASDACTVCHNPHGSQIEHLLVAQPKELCARCHDIWADEFDVAGSTHAPVNSGKCGQCHNPHASEHQTLLLRPADQLCGTCHSLQEMGLSEAAFLHAPFEANECLNCHAAHGSSEVSLLTRPGQALCYECHYKADFKDPETHADIDEMPCYECHNAHGADNESLIM